MGHVGRSLSPSALNLCHEGLGVGSRGQEGVGAWQPTFSIVIIGEHGVSGVGRGQLLLARVEHSPKPSEAAPAPSRPVEGSGIPTAVQASSAPGRKRD